MIAAVLFGDPACGCRGHRRSMVIRADSQRNASLYDPYWSVAPLVIVPLWLCTQASESGIALSGILFLIAIYAFGDCGLPTIGLNRWKGLSHQDWRYTMLRHKNPRLYFDYQPHGDSPIIPTVLVFLGMAPVFYATGAGGEAGPFDLYWFCSSASERC